MNTVSTAHHRIRRNIRQARWHICAVEEEEDALSTKSSNSGMCRDAVRRDGVEHGLAADVAPGAAYHGLSVRLRLPIMLHAKMSCTSSQYFNRRARVYPYF